MVFVRTLTEFCIVFPALTKGIPNQDSESDEDTASSKRDEGSEREEDSDDGGDSPAATTGNFSTFTPTKSNVGDQELVLEQFLKVKRVIPTTTPVIEPVTEPVAPVIELISTTLANVPAAPPITKPVATPNSVDAAEVVNKDLDVIENLIGLEQVIEKQNESGIDNLGTTASPIEASSTHPHVMEVLQDRTVEIGQDLMEVEAKEPEEAVLAKNASPAVEMSSVDHGQEDGGRPVLVEMPGVDKGEGDATKGRPVRMEVDKSSTPAQIVGEVPTGRITRARATPLDGIGNVSDDSPARVKKLKTKTIDQVDIVPASPKKVKAKTVRKKKKKGKK